MRGILQQQRASARGARAALLCLRAIVRWAQRCGVGLIVLACVLARGNGGISGCCSGATVAQHWRCNAIITTWSDNRISLGFE